MEKEDEIKEQMNTNDSLGIIWNKQTGIIPHYIFYSQINEHYA